MRNESRIRCRLALLFGVCVGWGCGGGDETASARAAAGVMPDMRGAAGASSLSGLAASSDSPRDPLQPSAASADVQPAARLEGCAPGVYRGEYDIGFLGAGPIMFTLVASEPSSSAGPCLEFCPELVVSSDGGEFSASLIDVFAGSAKLKGGLDCRSGEFRVEMVDGYFSLGSADDPMALQLGERPASSQAVSPRTRRR